MIPYHSGVSFKTQDQKTSGYNHPLIAEEGKRFREVTKLKSHHTGKKEVNFFHSPVYLVMDGQLREIQKYDALYDDKDGVIELPKNYIDMKNWPIG